MAPAHDKNAVRKGRSTAGASTRLPSEPTEDTPVYVISSNHGLTADVPYWNEQDLLQLCAQWDFTGTWSVDGKVMNAPLCRGSSSITRASYVPSETVSNTMLSSLACWDACSCWSMMISRRLPCPPSVCRSGSRTTWLSSWHGNRSTRRTVKDHVRRVWMRFTALPPALTPPPPQQAVARGQREARTLLRLLPQQRWSPHHHRYSGSCYTEFKVKEYHVMEKQQDTEVPNGFPGWRTHGHCHYAHELHISKQSFKLWDTHQIWCACYNRGYPSGKSWGPCKILI